jgi:hypothetical protein
MQAVRALMERESLIREHACSERASCSISQPHQSQSESVMLHQSLGAGS